MFRNIRRKGPEMIHVLEAYVAYMYVQCHHTNIQNF